ncbi:alpha/beta hydrolase [Variovorax sp. PAMC26660]|uniref:alpha/beta hydrolase n=1 Tax=Variovorax sp. PAMC26660 TaxID=2762322 RepID=UPI00164DDC17|nr:alpha/beta hydrolase [Variovorax sp. PAMC26660]QNK68333.1 alpha/beta fold hydrolase [Variovorax sp. PAMC26660]
MTDTTLAPLPLPAGIRSRQVDNGNGLSVHLLEAGFETPGRPCVLLLHGFPELAYSWRKVMLPLAEAGYHVIAPDQRGYGRTTGWQQGYDAGLDEFRLLNLVRDALGLLAALGHDSVEAVVGHDFGSPVAAWCALTRPDVFRSVVLMSAPFGGPPSAAATGLAEATRQLLDGLAALHPPRQHYQWYYSTREANGHMQHAPQGLHAFLRAYYHHKSVDWPQNQPFRLAAMSAEEMARLPSYYVMRADQTMAETVAQEIPSPEQIAACRWLPDDELAIYAAEYARTGFQGGLQWYRCGTSGRFVTEMQGWAGRTINVPSCFIAGRSDWGIYQKPGDFEAMHTATCTQMRGVHLVEGAGHWVQQEQPGEVSRLLLGFLRETATRR